MLDTMKLLSLMLLICLGLMILLPAAAIAPAGGRAEGAVAIGALDVCHSAAPGAVSGMPHSIHECPCDPAPLLLTGSQHPTHTSFKPLLIASRDERPPQA